jgi:putative Holliday junction resolvase
MDAQRPNNGASAPGNGRAMALDLGEKRIGVALSDGSWMVARSFSVLKRSSRLTDFERISRIIDEEGVTLLIVGLPSLPSGGEGKMAAWVRDYAADLSKHVEVEIRLWDESFTTSDAEESLRVRGVRAGRRRKQIDAVAAAFILQSFLDAR